MKTSLILSALVLGLATRGWAQTAPTQATPPLAGPPVQKRAPDFACWSIVATEPIQGDDNPKEQEDAPLAADAEQHSGTGAKKNSAKAGRATHSDGDRVAVSTAAKKAQIAAASTFMITKAEHVIHIERTDDRKQTWNIWIADGHEFSVSPDGQTVAEVAPPANRDVENPLHMDFSKTDFPGFEWVATKNFTGVEEVNDKTCLVFRDVWHNPENDSEGHPSAEGAPRYAAVDYYSRLPVAVAIGGERRDYAFKFPPRAALTVPENVARAFQTLAAEKKATERVPSKPY
jgi:hypothetical protein